MKAILKHQPLRNKPTTKQRIASAAYALFKEQGFDKVKINDICEACKITKPGFYYHFKSKESLLVHFYDGVIERINQRALSFVMADNYWQQLLIIYDELMEASNELGVDLSSQLLMMNLKQDRGTFDFNQSLATLTIALIAKAQQSGQIRNSSSPAELFESAAFAFLGCEVTWCIKNAAFGRKEIFHQTLEVLFDLQPKLRCKNRFSALHNHYEAELSDK